uniref:Fatty acid hydroxylase domain-containing protein n=1 Tax=Chromera velia CCMP2878 TaxID=1169474 RepID=A0A0G4HRI8_9ALVE|eukprot:Cvel_8134.t1-p1 / transcript=Cvel_8134.t1 / gene=Cvel_8134 / organism=Chromera_velia_CCMP2878 / gene_product=Putative methylsterol monooxygenase DDB_G0269788, putative / transcript_product=Putative methylsterol monooxygenase DDB_G0269788, putative / location=Cvel_scaffold442:63081-66623(-) / protein_length=520 / sequence_SO=supercontig / SO=protein_coding / is_pseudo=false
MPQQLRSAGAVKGALPVGEVSEGTAEDLKSSFSAKDEALRKRLCFWFTVLPISFVLTVAVWCLLCPPRLPPFEGSVIRFLYTFIYLNLPDAPKSLAVMPLVTTWASELAVNGFFTHLDVMRYPFLDSCRIHYCSDRLGTRKYPPAHEILHAMKLFFKGYLYVITPLHTIPLILYYVDVLKFAPAEYLPENISDWKFIKDMVLCILMADWWNYWMHRMMHWPFFYRRLHKMHHEYTYTFVWVNHVFHDWELILFGLSVVGPPLLLKAHLMVHWGMIVFTVVHTGYQHSGYILPHLPNTSPFHDAHHYLINKNFSSHTPFFDMLFGTYAPNTSKQRDLYSWVRPYVAVYPCEAAFRLYDNYIGKKNKSPKGGAGQVVEHEVPSTFKVGGGSQVSPPEKKEKGEEVSVGGTGSKKREKSLSKSSTSLRSSEQKIDGDGDLSPASPLSSSNAESAVVGAAPQVKKSGTGLKGKGRGLSFSSSSSPSTAAAVSSDASPASSKDQLPARRASKRIAAAAAAAAEKM